MGSKELVMPDGVGFGNEALKNYDEGTWVPTIVGTATAGVGTYTQQTGYYTRIGRIITVNGRVGYTAHTGTGNIAIGGLPFPCANVANNFHYGIGDLYNVALTASHTSYIGIAANSSVINFYQMPVGGGLSTLVNMDVAADISFSLTYTI